jgi:predicted AlkP superfamily pyrophosphatase or phosphodiesterase
VKFTHDGGEIEVSLQLLSEENALTFVKEPKHHVISTLFDKTQWLQFSVRDTGMGIFSLPASSLIELIIYFLKRDRKRENTIYFQAIFSGGGFSKIRNAWRWAWFSNMSSM